VRVALSCLYSPFDEFDPTRIDGDPPEPEYFERLLCQLDDVEARVRQFEGASVATSPDELERVLGAGQVAVVHSVEGGFHLGASDAQVRKSVAQLAERGVASITLAHLFYRGVATNVAAIPFLPDRVYHWFFRQPNEGLTKLGVATIEACAEHGVLVDVTHCTERSLEEVFGVLDRVDPQRRIPLICSHGATRLGRPDRSAPDYNLTDEWVVRIAERGGVIGLLLCNHYMATGLGLSLGHS
jgi:microsomal dipeptidase-like Zn-dependent dipeptidase